MIMESVLKEALEKLGYKELRPNQRQVIEHYIAGKDVLFCSPTGSGKSLTFEAAPSIYKGLSADQSPCVVIVVSPLTSLMKTQVRNLQAKGMKAVYLRDMHVTSPVQDDTLNQVDHDLKKLSINEDPDKTMEIIFSSPESLLGNYRDLVLRLARIHWHCVSVSKIPKAYLLHPHAL